LFIGADGPDVGSQDAFEEKRLGEDVQAVILERLQQAGADLGLNGNILQA